MRAGDTLRKNLEFWHWYPRFLCEGLTDEQLHWQPEDHPNHIMFTMWHAYRSEDEIVHGLLIGQPSVFTSGGWAERLPVAETGNSPFGSGLNRKQIGQVRLRLDDLMEYAEAVRQAIQTYADGLSDEEAALELPLPFFKDLYPILETATREEVLLFFCIGHTAEHLGEVQYIKGLMGMKGSPL